MSGYSQEQINHHIRIYMGVFLALAVLTIVTVAVSYLKLSLLPAIALALFIATIKGSLVAVFFMHLSNEKKIIYSILLVAAFLFLFALVTPALHHL